MGQVGGGDFARYSAKLYGEEWTLKLLISWWSASLRGKERRTDCVQRKIFKLCTILAKMFRS